MLFHGLRFVSALDTSRDSICSQQVCVQDTYSRCGMNAQIDVDQCASCCTFSDWWQQDVSLWHSPLSGSLLTIAAEM